MGYTSWSKAPFPGLGLGPRRNRNRKGKYTRNHTATFVRKSVMEAGRRKGTTSELPCSVYFGWFARNKAGRTLETISAMCHNC